MIDGKYEVLMKTPLGPKRGAVTLRVEVDGSVSGNIEIMGNVNAFTDGVADGEHCTFSGEIKTPMGKIPYITDGYVEGKNLTAVAKTKKGDMSITGRRVST